jgi:hypothetical protein
MGKIVGGLTMVRARRPTRAGCSLWQARCAAFSCLPSPSPSSPTTSRASMATTSAERLRCLCARCCRWRARSHADASRPAAEAQEAEGPGGQYRKEQGSTASAGVPPLRCPASLLTRVLCPRARSSSCRTSTPKVGHWRARLPAYSSFRPADSLRRVCAARGIIAAIEKLQKELQITVERPPADYRPSADERPSSDERNVG